MFEFSDQTPACRAVSKSRARLEAENLILRQQVIVLNRRFPSRIWLKNIDRLIFVWIYRLFPSILNAITVVKPETVIRWHRCGFRTYWRWKSRRRGGRPRIDREIRDLIRRMNGENPLWGATKSDLISRWIKMLRFPDDAEDRSHRGDSDPRRAASSVCPGLGCE
jgi:hypothetical protein